MSEIKVNGFLTLILIWIALPPPCRGDERLVRLQTVYEQSLKTIENDHAEDVRTRPTRYRAMLSAALKTCQRLGDLKGVLAVREEQERFEQARMVPDSSDANAAPSVASAQTEWRERNAQADMARHRGIVNLADKYMEHLEALKRERTVQGRFEDAVAAQKETERVRHSAAVTTAQFALALAERETVARELELEPEPVPPVVAPSPAPVVQQSDACPSCEGSGRVVNDCLNCRGTGRCRSCNGTGQRRSGIRGIRGTVGCVACRMTGHCRACEGTGKGPGPCPACRGSGRTGS